MWTLVDCLRHNVNVPRVLLRNRKRDCATFESSQVSTDVLMDEPTSVQQSSLPETLQTVPPCLEKICHVNGDERI